MVGKLGSKQQLDRSGHRVAARHGVHGSLSASTIGLVIGRVANSGAFFTSRLVDIFGLELYHPSSNEISFQSIHRDPTVFSEENRKRLTEPAIGPSWADLPFTLKVTPLGALDLTSKLAAHIKKTRSAL